MTRFGRSIGLPGRPLSRAPVPEQRHPAEHGRLARARRRRAQRVGGVRRVPEVGQDVHAARLELGRLRVLVLVDHVLVERQVHQPMDLGLEPRLAERGEVLPRVAVEHAARPPRSGRRAADRSRARGSGTSASRPTGRSTRRGRPPARRGRCPWRAASRFSLATCWLAYLVGDGNGNPGRPGTPEPGSPGSPGRPAGTAELTSLGSSGPRIASTNGTVVWMRNWPMVELSSCWLTVLRKPSPVRSRGRRSFRSRCRG